MEIWKPMVGYEGLYSVSNRGIVKSEDREVILPKGEYIRPGEIKNLTLGSHGYLMFSVRKDGISKNYLVHRAVAEAFISNPDNKEQVNHKDGNKRNNQVENIEWVTHKENAHHAKETGLSVFVNGEKIGRSILTSQEVRDIRAEYQEGIRGYGYLAIATRWGLTRSHVRSIIKREIWKHI